MWWKWCLDWFYLKCAWLKASKKKDWFCSIIQLCSCSSLRKTEKTPKSLTNLQKDPKKTSGDSTQPKMRHPVTIVAQYILEGSSLFMGNSVESVINHQWLDQDASKGWAVSNTLLHSDRSIYISCCKSFMESTHSNTRPTQNYIGRNGENVIKKVSESTEWVNSLVVIEKPKSSFCLDQRHLTTK